MLDLKIVADDKYMPSYATPLDACMDLKARGGTVIKPNEKIVLGTGVQVSIPEGHVMLIFPRSSTGIKLHCMLSNTVGVIDSGYRDEIKMALYNFGDKEIVIEDGQRIAQFMIIPRPQLNLIKVIDDDNFRQNDRGGGIGSTNK